MKAATIFYQALGLVILPVLLLCLVLPPQQTQAQEYDDSESSETYNREELAQMLAPIALYPDVLLSQVLMASTYPDEVVEADRWIGRDPELNDEALDEALLDQEWDPSVKALCHFPSILALMSERSTETANLGDAFLAQEDEVMDVVQELRATAYAQGSLAATAEQQVRVEDEVIIIEPTDSRVVYVPYYDPFAVYGPRWSPAYPPSYWGPPGVDMGIGLSFWPGVYFGLSFSNWSYFDWGRHDVYIDAHKRPRFVRHDQWVASPGRWTRGPGHRPVVVHPAPPPVEIYQALPPRAIEVHGEIREVPEFYDPGHDRFDAERMHIERTRQEREGIDRERKLRERDDRDRSERHRIDREREEQLRVKPERKPLDRAKIKNAERDKKKEPARVDRKQRGPRPDDRDQQQRVRVENERRERAPGESAALPGKHADRDKPKSPQLKHAEPARKRPEPARHQPAKPARKRPEPARHQPAKPAPVQLERKIAKPAGSKHDRAKQERVERKSQPKSPAPAVKPVKIPNSPGKGVRNGQPGKGDSPRAKKGGEADRDGQGRNRLNPRGANDKNAPPVGPVQQ